MPFGQDDRVRLGRLESRLVNLSQYMGCTIQRKQDKEDLANKVIVHSGRIVVTTPSVTLGEITTAILESGRRGSFWLEVCGRSWGEVYFNKEDGGDHAA